MEQDEHEAPKEAPDDEVPARTVPYAGDGEDNENRESPDFGAAAAERQVDVVPEPCAKGDMPTAPKLLGIARHIGAGKVEGKADTQATRDAKSDEAVSGKIVVDAEAEDDVVEPNDEGVLCGARIEMHGEVVCQAHFEKQTDDDPDRPFIDCFWIPTEAELLHLGQKVFPPLDRAGYYLGKECGEIHEIQKPRKRMLVDDCIDNKPDYLKGVERQAYWNDQLRESRNPGLQNSVNDEVTVFVIEERQQLQGHEDDKEPVAVKAGSPMEKSQAKVGDNADKKKNPQRGQADASE